MLVLLGVVLQAGSGCAEPGAADPVVTNLSITLPNMAALRADAASRWPSLIGRRMRCALFDQIEALTAEHRRLLSAVPVRTLVEDDASSWACGRTGQPVIRPQESAIIAGILLQTDVLDGVLAARDPARARALREARQRRRVRADEDRIFGDGRDNVFCFCADALRDISALQVALGGQECSWPRLARGAEQREVETYLLDSLKRLTDQAGKLR